MDIFIKVLENEIVDVSSAELDDKNYHKISVNSLDAFFLETSNYARLSSELEENVKEILNDSEEIEDSIDGLETYNIKHWISNRSFGELIDMYESGEIVKPNMQRQFVWDSIKCSRLIESIILGLPIPPLFLLEVDINQYELIDGFQRLNTLFNFVKGKPWMYENTTKKKLIASRLSKNVSPELQGKSFEKLSENHQRIIKRSTIPLIEFKQLTPDNYNSKYLIFERINTGSEKLTPMQIRKSLAHGIFLQELYKLVDKSTIFNKLFAPISLKKDLNIEAFLRIIVMYDYYSKNFDIEKEGIKNILNEYCEKNKDGKVPEYLISSFFDALELAYSVFKSPKEMFRRVEIKKDDYVITGNMNVSILESFLTTTMIFNAKNIQIDAPERILMKYKKNMFEISEKVLIEKESNPFTTSTGSKKAINSRFKIMESIIGKD